jgi:hypothetical protein
MTKHQTISTADGITIISVECRDCHEAHQFHVRTDAYDQWVNGALIQRVMPEIPEDQRELLISGTCGKCFDLLFDEDEEES